MCTVTYCPLQNEKILIGTCRDESIKRKPASPPSITERDNGKLLAPTDTESGGTWVGASANGRYMVIMNGAFFPHIKQPPYHTSRGIIGRKNFEYNSAPEFADFVNLSGIEPFTSIMIDLFPVRLYEFKWDGHSKHFYEIRADKPHIWSSENLFLAEVRQKREIWFGDFLHKNPEPDLQLLESFYLSGGHGAAPEERINMNYKDLVKTVSLTLVEFHGTYWEMYYNDFAKNQNTILCQLS